MIALKLSTRFVLFLNVHKFLFFSSFKRLFYSKSIFHLVKEPSMTLMLGMVGMISTRP